MQKTFIFDGRQAQITRLPDLPWTLIITTTVWEFIYSQHYPDVSTPEGQVGILAVMVLTK